MHIKKHTNLIKQPCTIQRPRQTKQKKTTILRKKNIYKKS